MKIDELSMEELLKENARRVADRNMTLKYDPITGVGCVSPRTIVRHPVSKNIVLVPVSMKEDADYNAEMDETSWVKLRHRHDFEYWAATCVHIRHKITGATVRLVLNTAQRKLLAEMERQRHAGEPVRIIVLKARQWGGSTLVQAYFAWIQCCRKHQWHSMIVANVCDISATIRGMYSTLLNDYPREWWQGEGEPKLKIYEGSTSIRFIPDRNCRIATASAWRPDSTRGMDCSMAHLSEVAYWPESTTMQPETVVQSVCGGIPMVPETVVVMESTANGVGNYFHSVWLKAKEGSVAFKPVFVAWYEIEMNYMEVKNPEYLVKHLTKYEKKLWEKGLTLEQILWYRRKRLEMTSDLKMNAEYPTTDIEAFNSSINMVFDTDSIERLRGECCAAKERGEVTGSTPKGAGALRKVRFQTAENGEMRVWGRPVHSNKRYKYVVAVDVGGRSESADWSVIAVFDRLGDDGSVLARPKVVAQWRGHIFHDLLAWKAAAIAKWYDNALLVVESNTLETEESDAGMILELLAQHYRDTYVRRSLDTLTQHETSRVGFHTNRSTKALIIDNLLGMVRDAGYVERDEMALNELASYEKKRSGAYGARQGCHDDILMTRAIGLYVISTLPKASLEPGDLPLFVPRL